MSWFKTAFSATLMLITGAANAALTEVGPIDEPSPPGNGFPQFYTDSQGLSLDLCVPQSNAQLEPCLFAPAGTDPAQPPLPFVFSADPAQMNFPDELFWFTAEAELAVPTTAACPDCRRAIILAALEAAFSSGTGEAEPGAQIAFARIRLTIDTPVAGTYTVTHPYGQRQFTVTTPSRRGIRFTEDIGGVLPGNPALAFQGALSGHVDPFLTPVVRDATGFETAIPPLEIPAGSGALFLTDGVTPVQVTGSPFGTNVARVCVDAAGGMDGNTATPGDECVETDLFTLIGKVHGDLPPNAPPVARDDAASTPAGQAVTVQVLANDTDPGGDPLRVTTVTQPANGEAVANAAGTGVIYIPDAGFSGTNTFTYTISDGKGGSASALVTVTVTAAPPANEPPVANPDSRNTLAGQAVTVQVLANDIDPDSDPLRVTRVTQPANGTAAINAARTAVTYTPAAGFTGTNAFNYTISDGKGGTASSRVTVQVRDRVTITVATYTRATRSWRITGTGSVPGKVITVRRGSATGPAIGTATVSAAGAWSVVRNNSTVPLGTATSVFARSSGLGTATRALTIR